MRYAQTFMLSGLALSVVGCGVSSPAQRSMTEHAVSAPRASSPASLPKDGSLESYVRHALKHHPRLDAQQTQWQEATARSRSVDRLPNPILTYTFAPLPIETRLGPQYHRVQLRQSLPWWSIPQLEVDAAAQSARAEVSRFDWLFLGIRREVITQYWSIWLDMQRQEVIQAQLTLLKSLEQSLSAQVKIGQRPASDLTQVSMRVVRLQDQLKQARAGVEMRTAMFAATLGSPDVGALSILPNDTMSPRQPKQALAELIKFSRQHPQIVTLQRLIEARRLERERATLRRRPDLFLGAEWAIITQGDLVNEDAGRDAVMVSVGVSIPLWGKADRAVVDQGEARVLRAQANLRQAMNMHYALLRRAYIKTMEANRGLMLTQHTLLPQAQTNYTMVLGAYESQKAQITAVLLAAQTLLDLQQRLLRDQATLAQSWAELEMLVGRPLASQPYTPKRSTP